MISPIEFIILLFIFFFIIQFIRGIYAGLRDIKFSALPRFGWISTFIGISIIYLIFAWPDITKNYQTAYDNVLKKENENYQKTWQNENREIQEKIMAQEKGQNFINRLKGSGFIVDIDWIGKTLSCRIKVDKRLRQMSPEDQNHLFTLIFDHYQNFLGMEQMKVIDARTGRQLGLFPMNYGGMEQKSNK